MTTAEINALIAAAGCANSCLQGPIAMPLMVHLLNLIANSGITVSSLSAGGDTCSTTAVQTDATALAANADRKVAKIRNLSTSAMYVQLGAGCTQVIGGYWEMLPGADSQDDWNSSYYVDIENYTGVVTVAGADLRYIATEIYQA